MFTHTAHDQGNISVYNALKGNKKKLDLRVIPRVTFVFPEVGSVGLTEKEARKKGFDVAIGRTSFSSISKPFLTGERDGVVKIVVDRKTKKILGGHIVGHAAAEMIHEIALAMFAHIPVTKIASMIHAYPTLSEAVGVAAYECTRETTFRSKGKGEFPS
jgi:dihydrolipoamide dehydrogenase